MLLASTYRPANQTGAADPAAQALLLRMNLISEPLRGSASHLQKTLESRGSKDCSLTSGAVPTTITDMVRCLDHIAECRPDRVRKTKAGYSVKPQSEVEFTREQTAAASAVEDRLTFLDEAFCRSKATRWSGSPVDLDNWLRKHMGLFIPGIGEKILKEDAPFARKALITRGKKGQWSISYRNQGTFR